MVAKPAYIPDARDIVWLDFDPQAGHEQAGHRPALVLTSREYNAKTGLMICCPITSKIKGHSFEVPVPPNTLDKDGVILVFHVKTVDFVARNARPLAKVPYNVVRDVRDMLAEILELE